MHNKLSLTKSSQTLPETSPSVDIVEFTELTRDQLYEILELRGLVFVVGQQITAVAEIDGRDPQALHVMLRVGRTLVGTARIFARQQPMTVGRVAIHPDWQRQGWGTTLMEAIQRHLGERPCQLHAQAHLEPWYERLGWQRRGDNFDEAGRPHLVMQWQPSAATRQES